MANEKRLIDSNALLLSIRTTLVRSKYKYAKNQIISDVLDGFDELVMGKVKNAPTVDAVEAVHGRWIPLEYDGYADGNPVWDLWECSECQEEHSGDEDTLTPYCPNCGAKMDGDGNGTA